MKSIRDSLSAIHVAAALAWSRRANFLERVEQAQDIIRRGFEVAPDAYVACSFGKDSAVLTHLCLQYAPRVSVRFLRWDESAALDNYDEVIQAWRERFDINLVIADMQRVSLDEKNPKRWQSLERAAPSSGYFIGLRAEESRGRRITLKMQGEVYRKQDGLWRISPLAWWREQDIAAYVIAHDLPMLNTYHVEGLSARTTARVPRAVVRGEALARLRLRDPHGFERLAAMFPEVREWV